MLGKFITGLFAFAGSLGVVSGANTPDIIRIEPPFWWTGMKNDTLQLLIEGNDIAGSRVSVEYPGVRISEDISLDSPNYKLLYLQIGEDAKPGEVKLQFSQNGHKKAVSYILKERKDGRESVEGFSSKDVLYLLMPDRFATSGSISPKEYADLKFPVGNDRNDPNGRHGGDIKGIEEHLDYLKDLGVTALWVCPVLENDMPGGSYHGYATTDYYRIDPRFGTNEDWKNLIDSAHSKGLKVVMDMIFNHSGVTHRWMKDMPSKDWYNHPEGDVMTNFRLSTLHDPYVSDYDLDRSVNGWFVPGMPDLNQRNPHLMKYLIQNSIWWIETSGINGIRMDTYPYADMDGMATWAREVMTEYPNFNLVGECWYGQEDGSAFWQSGNRLNPRETELPSVMDFKLLTDGRKMFNEETDPWNGLNHLYDHLSHDYLFPNPKNILTFLDNHDSDRFLLEEPENLGSWKQAIAWLLTSRGIPQIYYGTEILMSGSKEGSDGFVRRDFPGGFKGDARSAFSPEGRTEMENEAYDWISKILNWRKDEANNEVIANGSLKHFMPQNGLYVYERKLGDKQIVVIMNGSDKGVTKTMERTLEVLPYGSEWFDMISGTPITIAEEITLAPRQVMILQNY